MSISVAVVMGDGFEEIEAVTIIDVLRRAKFNVDIVSTGSRMVSGAHGIHLQSDQLWLDVDLSSYAAVVFPGGEPNSTQLASDDRVINYLRQARTSDQWLGAICAAPKIFDAAGILDGISFTAYPSLQDRFSGHYIDSSVVLDVDRRIVTSQGVGTSLDFSLTLVEQLSGKSMRDVLASSMVISS
jgi:protein deglycase